MKVSASFYRSSCCCSQKNLAENGWNSNTQVRFLWFSQKFNLRNTADLLDFTPHRVLSIPSVKLLCCRNAIPHTLRGEVTCGSFQLYIWRINLYQTLSFTSPLWNKLVFKLTEEIIIQSEPEKQDKNQKSKRKFLKTCQILKLYFLTCQFLKFVFFSTCQMLM